MNVRGFITQANYRVVTQPDGRPRSIIYLYGRLEDGATFLVRDNRQRPFFYVLAGDMDRALALGAPTGLQVNATTFDGLPVCKLEFDTPGDLTAVRDRLHASNIETFEADVRFAVRYLIERGVKAGCTIEGEARAGHGVSWIFDNPTLHPADVRVDPRVLSFDIETDAKGERLLAISLYAPDIDEVLIVDEGGREMPEKATRCESEFAALTAFCDRVRTCDPDVLTGWNIVDFDLSVLARIAARVGHPFDLGRLAGPMRLRKAEGYFGSGQASIPGRLVLDGIDLLRGAFVRMDDYSLDAVAREVLGEGKAVKGDVRDRVDEILHNYRHDLPAFALYARTDARLAYDILRKLNLVPLAFERSRLTGMTPDRVAASIASFDFLYLSELRPLRHRRTQRSRRRFARIRSAARRPRTRTRHGPAQQRLGVRFQEPLPQRHPYLQYRPTILCRSRRPREPTSSRRPAGRFGASRPSCRACSTNFSQARGGATSRRRRGRERHQDPDELVLRRARHSCVPFL